MKTYITSALCAISLVAAFFASADCGRCGEIGPSGSGGNGGAGMGGAGGAAPTHCAAPEDCDITPGPCGVVRCDVVGIIGAPPLVGALAGCYVSVATSCLALPCSATSNCSVLVNIMDCPRCIDGGCKEGNKSDAGICVGD